MKTVAVVAIMIAVASCSPQRRLARLIDHYPDLMPRDTVVVVRDTTIYRDTTVYRTVFGGIVHDSIPIPIEVDLPYMSLKRAISLAWAEAWVEGRQLDLTVGVNDSVFEFKLDSAIRLNKDTVFQTVTIEVPKIIKPKPTWKVLTFAFGGLLVLTIILQLLFLWLKRK